MGAHTDGSVQNVTISAGRFDLYGWYVARVRAWPVSGGTAPDAADVTVKDGNGYDVLEAGGANLIHATNAQAVGPTLSSTILSQPVIGDLTIGVANQGTSGADFAVAVDFLKER